MDAEATESVARRILLGLGFSQEQLDGPYQALSGGWRSRCSLASVLVQNPDVVCLCARSLAVINETNIMQLILDEPTNYLDIPAILWLQDYIQALESTTVLIVAHDRDFLDEATEETIILRKRTLAYHEGGITATEQAIMKKRVGMIRMKEGLDRKKASVEQTIAKAKNSMDDKKRQMAASRQKKLDDRWGAEVNAKGHR
jgi:ATP-binding cassette, subfamily F, member 3